MSNVQATVVEDSIAPSGVRLTTMLLTYATIVHQDILTHRTIYKLRAGEIDESSLELQSNKSTNSNRAKPTKQVIGEVWRNPFVPAQFPKRAVSMHSSKGHLTGWRHHVARQLWLKARYVMLAIALLLMWLPGVHKQIANRLLMPWTYTTLVMTAIDAWWQHFFNLRDHYMAQDEVIEVASLAHQQYDISMPKPLNEGEWHLPFLTIWERSRSNPLTAKGRIALSVARCARTSYATDHYTMMEVAHSRHSDEDFELFERLNSMTPEHAGPKEHQASAHSDPNHVSGTLIGWDQLRHHPIAATLSVSEDSPSPAPLVRV